MHGCFSTAALSRSPPPERVGRAAVTPKLPPGSGVGVAAPAAREAQGGTGQGGRPPARRTAGLGAGREGGGLSRGAGLSEGATDENLRLQNIIVQGHFHKKVVLRGFIAVCREDFNYHVLRGVIISAAALPRSRSETQSPPRRTEPPGTGNRLRPPPSSACPDLPPHPRPSPAWGRNTARPPAGSPKPLLSPGAHDWHLLSPPRPARGVPGPLPPSSEPTLPLAGPQLPQRGHSAPKGAASGWARPALGPRESGSVPAPGGMGRGGGVQ